MSLPPRSPATTQKLLINRSNQTALAFGCRIISFPFKVSVLPQSVYPDSFLPDYLLWGKQSGHLLPPRLEEQQNSAAKPFPDVRDKSGSSGSLIHSCPGFHTPSRSPVTTEKLLINRSNQTALALGCHVISFSLKVSVLLRSVYPVSFLRDHLWGRGSPPNRTSPRNWTISASGSSRSCRRIRTNNKTLQQSHFAGARDKSGSSGNLIHLCPGFHTPPRSPVTTEKLFINRSDHTALALGCRIISFPLKVFAVCRSGQFSPGSVVGKEVLQFLHPPVIAR
ncbi:hypothetical protein CDAR_552431 [Caerostris darwini]|uniref:Uncharacterized protein n=1 Tax=Caerostris darwini TaxID=1538125 RepID=A0AAV4NPW1_9ARAC|nr:hypothetical protein CDAR_552431 [Caerostris darwini]